MTPLKLTESEYSNRVIQRFWNTMAAVFFSKWTSQAGAVPHPVWVRGLGDLTADEIAVGLNAVEAFALKSGGWPPNLPEFRELCRPAVPVVPAAHRPFPRLPAPRCNPDVARMHTQGILAKLRGTQTATQEPETETEEEWTERRKRQDAAIVAVYGRDARIDCSIYPCEYRATKR